MKNETNKINKQINKFTDDLQV